MWIDSHCHLDAAEFDADRSVVRAAARLEGVGLCVIPAVERANWQAVRELAHAHSDLYALGIHPLYVPHAGNEDLAELDAELTRHKDDPRLVAVGEIGLDYFVPALCLDAMRKRQWQFYLAQLQLAKRHGLPVVLHVRRSADMLLKGLRQVKHTHGGIAHAFNGSLQQAHAMIDLGFKLGFGGTLTYERALQIRRLAQVLPLDALVLETDAPDIPPQWLYVSADQRARGCVMQKNSPTELPQIGEVLAKLREISLLDLSQATTRNVQQLFSRFPFDQPPITTFG